MTTTTAIHPRGLGEELVTIETTTFGSSLRIRGMLRAERRLVDLPGAGEQEAHITMVLQRLAPTFLHDGGYLVKVCTKRDHTDPAFDLSIAASVMATYGLMPKNTYLDECDGTLLLGELKPNGFLLPMRGLFFALQAAARLGVRKAIVPAPNEREAAQAAEATGIDVRLATAVSDLLQPAWLPRPGPTTRLDGTDGDKDHDMADILGLTEGRRAIEIAAAGGHNILLLGSARFGRSVLAKRLPGILPRMTITEAREVTAIHSLAGTLDPSVGLVTRRPFRAPHHTVSVGSMEGSERDRHSYRRRPGEVSLAHGGVLFLDQLSEFRSNVCAAVADKLQGKSCGDLFTARPIVVAADDEPGQRLPEPLGLDRPRGLHEGRRGPWPLSSHFDLCVTLPRPTYHAPPCGESSHIVRGRVEAARAMQAERSARTGAPLNALCSPASLEATFSKSASGKLKKAKLTAEEHAKVVRGARTIADLSGSLAVDSQHVIEALGLVRQP